MYPPKVGRDHLGLGSVSSDQILPSLVPGINVLTVHPRYHSFYVFLLDEFWRSERPRSHSEWVRFYRPREFIFSVGAHLCDRPEHGDLRTIVGGQRTGPLAAPVSSEFDTAFEYIKSELGGYGLYYRSVIAEMGLIYPGGPGFPYPIDVPSEEGKKTAAAFRRAIQETTYYQEYFEQDVVRVPYDVVVEYIRGACLCQLQRQDAPDHRLVVDSFCHGGNVDSADARRATLRFFLDLADQTDGHSISQDDFRQLIYFGAAANGAKYHPRNEVMDTYKRWRLYQAREYYAFALNALWCHLCDVGLNLQGDLRPVPISEILNHMMIALDYARLAELLDVEPPGLTPESDFIRLTRWLEALVGADGAAFDERCNLDSPVHEHKLYRLAIDPYAEPAAMAAGMLTVLALITLRFGHPNLWMEPEWTISKMGSDGRLSVDGFLRSIRHRIQRGSISIGEVTAWLLQDYVILQHHIIATGKLPENTFRFQREGNRLSFFRLANRLDFTDSRFDAISTTVHELGFCGDFRLTSHDLTASGRELLERGDIQWTS